MTFLLRKFSYPKWEKTKDYLQMSFQLIQLLAVRAQLRISFQFGDQKPLILNLIM